MKHLPWPPDAGVREPLAVQPEGNAAHPLPGGTRYAVASLYRRHFETVQVTKTRSDPFSDGTFGLAAQAELPPTLEAYAMAEGEPFQMREHFESYLNAAASWKADGDAPKIFLQMEKKAEHLDRLAAFLGVEQSAPRRSSRRGATPRRPRLTRSGSSRRRGSRCSRARARWRRPRTRSERSRWSGCATPPASEGGAARRAPPPPPPLAMPPPSRRAPKPRDKGKLR